MKLATPLHLGGDHYLDAVSVGRDPDATTVRDCPVCGGHSFDDEWHLVATVTTVDGGTAGPPAHHYYCDDQCLREWLRLFPAT